ncbi:putative repeat protein (TIGR01451 family) [Streptomyces sp. KhCrAH-43]|nr:putative repeat protein (TIGR01451 family) [Streptomyces sp. KhCrAH-43]
MSRGQRREHVGAAGVRCTRAVPSLGRWKRRTTGALSSLALAAVAVVAVPSGPAAAVPSGPYLYVAGYGSGTVSVVDPATDTVAATIAVGGAPRSVALAPDGTRAYVSDYSRNNSKVSVIDTTTDTVTATIATGKNQEQLSVTPDGSRVYVANAGSASVSVIDTATETVSSTVPVSGSPRGLAVSPDGSRVYVTDSGSTVSVIDTATDTVSATIGLGNSSGLAVAFAPDGAHAYVSSAGDNRLYVIDTATEAVTASVGVGLSPHGVLVTPDGSRVYVANYFSNDVSVIDTATNAVTATIAVGQYPWEVALQQGGDHLYVSNSGSNNVSVVALATNTVTSGFGGVGSTPLGITSGVVRPAKADLAVALKAKANALLPGAIGYTLTVHNAGPNKATSAKVTATLPAGASATGLSPGCTASGNTVVCAFADIPASTSVTAGFKLPLSLLNLGQITVQAARTASSPTDPVPSNDTSSASCTVISILLATC